MDNSVRDIFPELEKLEKTMTHFAKLAAGLTGLAAIAAVSSPAAAQINPYRQVTPYGAASNGGVLSAIVNAVTGYGQYPQGNYGYEQTSQRSSVEMCVRTAEQRLNSSGRYIGYNNRYGHDAHGNGYAPNGRPNAYANNGYRNGGMFRVVGITNVERRTNGSLRVRGIASSNLSEGKTGWNQPGVDDQRYGNTNGHGYSNNNNRSAGMDYRFTCKINSRGAVTSLNLDRGTPSMRG
jgi:hypothetical protein